MAGDNLDRNRIRLAWTITGVWVACFPISTVVKDFPITWAQAPMMLVMGWLFGAPLVRRNNGGDQ